MLTKISYRTWQNPDGSHSLQYRGVVYILWPGDILRININFVMEEGTTYVY